VVNHVFHRHGERGVVAQNDIAQRIADEKDVDVAFVQDGRHAEVVGRQHGDFFTLRFHLLDVQNGFSVDLCLRAHDFAPFSIPRISLA